MMGNRRLVIGVDLGGTNIRSAIVSAEGSTLARDKRPTGAQDGYRSVIERIAESVKTVMGVSGFAPVAIGLAVPGAIDFKRGVVTYSPNLPGWINAKVAEDLSAMVAVPAYLENDANAAAAGEGWIGAAAEWENFSMLTLGTGVGGAIVLNRQVWHGSSGMAGELGHLPSGKPGRVCGCGRDGCVEAYASASGVMKTAHERFYENDAIWIRTAAGDFVGKVDARLLARGAGEGDPLCREIFDEAGACLGRILSAVALTLDVANVVIGGGMAEALAFIEPGMRREALKMAYTLNETKLKITKAALGDDAGILGAARIAMKSAGIC
ncbi:MAG: ROK family protein [Nitrospinae bacterium]|nr:ROK family protein [Nitrospinota bacterium]